MVPGSGSEAGTTLSNGSYRQPKTAQGRAIRGESLLCREGRGMTLGRVSGRGVCNAGCPAVGSGAGRSGYPSELLPWALSSSW
jgi:hypothetical protein